MSALRPWSYYDERAHSVDLTQITSSDNNAEILEQLHYDELTTLWIIGEQDDFRVDAFYLQEGDDLGWLGYFIGRSTVLRNLYIIHVHEDEDRGRIAALVRGIAQNISIRELGICGDHNVLSSLSAMLQSESCCLTFLELNNIPFGDDAAEALADVLKGCKSLTSLSLWDSDLSGYREQIPILISGIGQSRSIQKLSIEGDDLGESVLSSLSALLQSESCCLTSLNLFIISIRDNVAVALADALKGNKSLRDLRINSDDLTPVGWSAFSGLLCDTSSISNIYASNHTLQEIGYFRQRSNYPQDVKQLLALNRQAGKYAAIQKILKYHPDLDVGPFLAKSKLKLLPLVLSWFERGRGMSEESEKAFDARQLSTMYNFVRGMPLVAVDGYRSYSIHKKERFDLLGRNFIVMCTLLLLCLLNLRLPTWGDFVASSLTLCVCLLQVVSLLLKE
jgi:hypothetical protein